jgi:hypothetical protein
MGNCVEDVKIQERQEKQQARRVWIPRRRVPVSVRLNDNSVVSGELYAEVKGSDGAPGRVLDRLNDPLETYLPLAANDRHILLNKSGIATVRLAIEEGGALSRGQTSDRELRVSIILSSGERLDGRIRASLENHARLLDYLNSTKQMFFAIEDDNEATLINGGCILSVTEQLDTAATTARAANLKKRHLGENEPPPRAIT